MRLSSVPRPWTAFHKSGCPGHAGAMAGLMEMSEKESKMRIGEYLVKGGNITKWQLDLALEDQKKNGGLLGEILVRMGYLENDELIKALTSRVDD